MASVSDEARENLLTELVLTEPQPYTNSDLMRLLLEDPTQTLVTETEASAAIHLERYLMELRQS